MIPACGLTLPQRKSNKGKDMKNDYYVYVHKIKATGEIFYVGKGRNLRYRSQHGRNRIWKEIVSDNECIFEILISDLTEDEAVQLEIDKIDALKPRANVHKSAIIVN